MTSTEIKLSKEYLTRSLQLWRDLRTFKDKSRLIMNRDSINPFTKRDNGSYELNFDVLADLIVAICKNRNIYTVSVNNRILTCNIPYIPSLIAYSFLKSYLLKHSIELYKQPEYYGDDSFIQDTYIYINSVGIEGSLAGGYIEGFAIQEYIHYRGTHKLHRQYAADYVLYLTPPHSYNNFLSVEQMLNRKYKA